MRLPNHRDRFRVMRLADGEYSEEEAVCLTNTLFGAMFKPEKALLVRVEKPEGEDRIDKQKAQFKAVASLQRGVLGRYPLGSGNGAKQGRFWFADSAVHRVTGPYFDSAESAVAYAGCLFSENRFGLFVEEGAEVQVDPDGADGMGYVDARWLEKHGLPVRQVQIRAAFEKALVKGTLLPVTDLREREGATFMFHPTMIKGEDPTLEGKFYLGIRDVGQVRDFRSGWTVCQWFSQDTQDELWERYGLTILERISRAFQSNDEALRFLSASKEEDEDRNLLEKYLKAGLPVRHPWLNMKLRQHARPRWIEVALGLGLPMKGGMAHYSPDLADDEISCPWIADGAEVVVTRYPVRDPWSFQVVRNRLLPETPEGSIGTNGHLGLDDDQDGDFLVVIADRTVTADIRRRHSRCEPRLPRQTKQRRQTSMMGLARIMVESMSNGCVGTPTWLVAGALNSCKDEFIPNLSAQIQNAVESLKWHSAVDWEFLRKVEEEVDLPGYLELMKADDQFTRETTEVEDQGLGRFWNAAVRHFNELMAVMVSSPREFVDYVPAPDGQYLSEVEAVRQAYNNIIAESEGDMEKILKAVKRLRAWAEKKDEDREEWAREVWWAVHLNGSASSTASMAIHAFPCECSDSMAQGASAP